MTLEPDISEEHARLIAWLESTSALSAEDREALAALPLHIRHFEANVDMVREGDRPQECCLISEGFACRYKLLDEGQRQILSFHIPGDVPDLQSLHLHTMDHSLATLTPVRAAFIPHAALHDMLQHSASLTAKLWRTTLIDAAIFREWLTGVGRRTGRQRAAHLICEIYVRLAAVGLTHDGGFDLPITQVELADALGLTSVHVNRVLQDLRHEGLIASKGRFLTVVDREGLQSAGDFDPAYLHLRNVERLGVVKPRKLQKQHPGVLQN